MVAGSTLGREHRAVEQASALLGPQAGFARAPLRGTGEGEQLRGWLSHLIREWLLLLLRFAITQDPKDEVVALIMAREIDCLGRHLGRSAPTFFRRSSREICKAITAIDSPEREAIFKRHLARIEDQRLKSAFQAALGLGPMRQQVELGARDKSLTARESKMAPASNSRPPI